MYANFSRRSKLKIITAAFFSVAKKVLKTKTQTNFYINKLNDFRESLLRPSVFIFSIIMMSEKFPLIINPFIIYKLI